MSDANRRIGHEGWEIGPDPELARVLAVLDPAATDAGYWLRFRTWVLTRAQRELTRRRLIAELTIGDVVSSWARTLVPSAALAAALAGMLLVRSPEPTSGTLALEEQLVAELPGETVPLLLDPDGAEGVVAFASEDF